MAQRYLGRHPDHPYKVVLSSTVPKVDMQAVFTMFERLGGEAARAAPVAFWTGPTGPTREAYLRICGPLYTQAPGNMFEAVETIRNNEPFAHWNAGENHTFDLRPDLARAQCPVLVLGGEMDPVCPIAGAEEIAACLPSNLVQFERLANSGHGVFRDEPTVPCAYCANSLGPTDAATDNSAD